MWKFLSRPLSRGRWRRSHQRINERRGLISERELDALVGDIPLLKQTEQPETGRVGTSCPLFEREERVGHSHQLNSVWEEQ
ncbi:hypothetical protein TNIN_308981 [Trichonephila inaurata madagascariensis]|uniref:Uncharacterized protein n=1 Tax=Trichonephila inaurata madagascariensis TaxID=2747483 RepID=A0A8X6X4K0_9ARAC|nr:hypothetical protein TNIN_308981 [Trichonephila inaurata madagascariensis]